MDEREKFCIMILQSTYDEVSNAISNKENEYKFFKIPKKNGYRDIWYLDDKSNIRKYQSSLTDNFFSRYSIPVVVKGFVKDENYFSFLKEHVRSNYFLRIDIKNYFGSIKFKHFQKFMHETSSFNDENYDETINLIWEIISYNDILVQGTVSSPVVSNLIFRRIDQRILKYCQELGIKYTRYADDLLFSSNSFDFINKKWFLRKIAYILKENDFFINYSKIKCCYQQISLNGFVISNKDIRLSRKRFKDINQVVWFINNNIDTIKEKDKFFNQFHTIDFTKKTKYDEIDTFYKLLQFLCGHRSFLIGCLKEYELSSKNKRKINNLLKKMEKCISKIINKQYPSYNL